MTDIRKSGKNSMCESIIYVNSLTETVFSKNNQ
jgi:hypothetical protein